MISLWLIPRTLFLIKGFAFSTLQKHIHPNSRLQEMSQPSPSPRYTSFQEFYPYYLSEHQDTTCRVLHFIGTALLLLITVAAIWAGNYKWLLLVPVVGYGFAWVGHFFYEHNKPATFQYPFYSLASDFVLFFDILRGKQSFKSKTQQ
jgi:hypothetical protein